MDQIIEHKSSQTTWSEKSLAYQMGNIGSEVYRAIKYKDNPKRFEGAFARALELFDFTIDSLQKKREFSRLKEVCRAREEFCDFFYDNKMNTNPKQLQAYYDQFASIR